MPDLTEAAVAQQNVDLPCEAIKIGERHRKDMGDLQGLAASIQAVGLLQPIGVTEDHLLVFGERRLRAVQDILGWKTISARVVHIESILDGECDENQVRKDFAPSERVAIAKTMQAQIGSRRGRRTDLALPRNCAEVTPGLETREIAARKAGFDSKDTYERAKKVVDRGATELVAAMDTGHITIAAAAELAELPAEEQRAALAEGPKKAKDRASARRIAKRSKPNQAGSPSPAPQLETAAAKADDDQAAKGGMNQANSPQHNAAIQQTAQSGTDPFAVPKRGTRAYLVWEWCRYISGLLRHFEDLNPEITAEEIALKFDPSKHELKILEKVNELFTQIIAATHQ